MATTGVPSLAVGAGSGGTEAQVPVQKSGGNTSVWLQVAATVVGVLTIVFAGSWMWPEAITRIVLAAVAAPVVLILALREPRILSLLLVVLVPVDTFADLSETQQTITLFKALFPLILCAVLLRRWTGRLPALGANALDRTILLWAGLNVVLIATAQDRAEAIDFVRRILSMAALYYVLSRLFSQATWNRRLRGAVVYAGAVSVVFGMIAYFSGANPYTDYDVDVVRISGAADISPNVYGMLLIPPMLLAAAGSLEARSKIRRAWFDALVMFLASGVVLTYSRSAALVLVLVAVVAVVTWRGRLTRSHWVALALAVALGLLIVPPEYWERLRTLSQLGSLPADDASLWRRSSYLRTGWNMFREHPFLGVGPGNFLPMHAQAAYQMEPSLIGLPRMAHDVYLQTVTEIGPLGLGLFLGVLGAAGSIAYRIARVDQPHSVQAQALAIAILAFSAMGFFSHLLLDKTFWIVLALIRTLPELDP